MQFAESSSLWDRSVRESMLLQLQAAPIESEYISNIRVGLACVGGRGHPASNAILLLSEEQRRKQKVEERMPLRRSSRSC